MASLDEDDLLSLGCVPLVPRVRRVGLQVDAASALTPLTDGCPFLPMLPDNSPSLSSSPRSTPTLRSAGAWGSTYGARCGSG
jgi:hypothetical protein